MVKRAHYLCAVAVLAATMILLGGCGSARTYPGWYSYNADTPEIPTQGRSGVGDAGPVVLGGTDAAFLEEFQVVVDVFGFVQSADLPRPVLGFNHYLNTFVDAVTVVRDVEDADRQHQIILVLLSAPPDQLWSPDIATKYSEAFSPMDAVYQRDAPVRDEEGLPGTDKVYTSETLAKTFPADAFVDENGELVAPGTFNIQCLYPSESQSNQVLSCQLALGTRQTNHV